MPGTGHSGRYKGSISNRNTKSAFQVLAPWNAKKNGEKNQVAVSTGGNTLNFELMGAKMMSNYNDASNAWVLDCSLVVQGNKIVDGKVTIIGDVDICGNVTIHGDLSGNDASFNDVDICGNLNVKGESTFNSTLTNTSDMSDNGIITRFLKVTDTAYIKTGDIVHLIDVSDNILTLGNHNALGAEEVRGVVAKYIHKTPVDTSRNAFFGMDPSFNGGLVHDINGQFVFLIDVSDNIFGTADEIIGCPGRACFGALDISGGTIYGGGDSGLVPDVMNQDNCSMHLIGKTIIAKQGAFPGISAKLDISGGINVDGDICGNGVNFAINYTNVDISGSTVDISGDTVRIDGASGVSIEAGNNSNFTTTVGHIQITGAQGVKIGGGANIVDISGLGVLIGVGATTLEPLRQIKLSDGSGAYIDMSGGKIDISGDDVTITGSSGSSLNLRGPKINIGEPGGTVEIQGNVKVDDAVTFVVTDLSATNIDVSGTLTVNGGRIDMSGTNTAVGTSALTANTEGHHNVATGFQALTANTEGHHNIATGAQALTANIDGDHNVATGYQALAANDSGDNNIATGYRALFLNTSGNNNIATGTFALYPNTSGDNNVATGHQALQDNIGGSYNTAIGYQAGNGQTDISNTINIGYDASCNVPNTACIGNVDISCVYFGSTSGSAKLDCSGIVSSGNMAINGTINTLTVGFGSGDISNNTVVGHEALQTNSVGSFNVAVGYQALNSNTDGSYNVAVGYYALQKNTIGNFNTATGYDALQLNTDGCCNVATGMNALYKNTTGDSNVATGLSTLFHNTTGNWNVAVGYQALSSNEDGSCNVAIGYNAGNGQTDFFNTINIGYDASCNASNTACIGNVDISCVYFGSTSGNAKLDCSGIVIGSQGITLDGNMAINGTINTLTVGFGGVIDASNTVVGYQALQVNTTGISNVAVGHSALKQCDTADSNTAVGFEALTSHTYGSQNTAVGYKALTVSDGGTLNVAVGNQALAKLTTGEKNTAIGYRAGLTNDTGNNNTFLGNDADASGININNTIWLGNSSIATLFCQVTSITALSDERDKKDIIDIPYGLEFINNLQPRQFTWDMRGETDDNPNQGTTRVGFIAQEVQTALGEDNAVLNMVDDSNPEKLHLSYGQLVPVLTKATQELIKKNENLEHKIADLETKLTNLIDQLKANNTIN